MDEKLLGYKRAEFYYWMRHELDRGIRHNKLSIEKKAASFGIVDKTMVKEYTELAIALKAWEIANETTSLGERYHSIVDLYNHQVNLSHRTSQSILLQQYSTPAPIAFLAGTFAGLHNRDRDFEAFEPSAGNGLLTIAGKPEQVTVNEIDGLRNSNLKTWGYKRVLKQDATLPFIGYGKKFDAIVTNPPFGSLDKEVFYDGFGIKALDHLMCLRALDCMKDGGKAAIIIGGHSRWDDKGRIEKGRFRVFFNYLYSHYNVADIIQVDGHKLYSRQGTAFDTRLILIDGRKPIPLGAAPVFDPDQDIEIKTFEALFDRVREAMKYSKNTDKTRLLELEAEALALELELMGGGLGAPYVPASESCVVLDTVVPDSMSFETQSALDRIKEAIGGDMDEFVRQRLNYASKLELCKALSAEQIDAVAMAIYNIEYRGQGMIIGDQTGIGKGRVAAAIIRYGVEQGHKPIFITEKANLFSDLYRDLVAIGSADLNPFIVNGRESKTDIKDEEGNVVYEALSPSEQATIFNAKRVPGRYNFVMATYSQFNSAEKKPTKPLFLDAIAEGNIAILDEAHNSSGSSNTGSFLQTVIEKTAGVIFLSATFAKRPDNMPIYAMKTAISEANMTKGELIDAIYSGGVALQEILSSQLVAEGQMLRRERSFEGVEVNYITLDEKEQEHKAIADNITGIVRDIIAFQTDHVDPVVDELDDIAVAEGKEVDLREGTKEAGVDNIPFFSKVFNVINQMLFSIKAESVAERAIMRLKEGKKPVIAFSSTMGSFIEQMDNGNGMAVTDGDVINADFAEVLRRGLDGILRYTEITANGERVYKKFALSELPAETQAEYLRITEKIKQVSTGITISPIDVIIRKIKEAGYSVAEVTGRKYELQINPKTNQGLILQRKKVNTNDAFRQFNNNEVDVLLINQSGSTGASAHAVPTAKVPADKVRQRVMIVLQAELDINTEVQKRGRVNRTGQLMKPIYDYVNSAIPAEKRLMMMLQKKLKSLDANTTSNQKQSIKILDVPDFLNKYGDKIVKDYLIENKDINRLLNDPLKLESAESSDGNTIEDAAHKVSGRVAVLSTKMQQDFYNEISSSYNDYVEYLKQIGEYDLEVEEMKLDAETVSEKIIKVGKGGNSGFGDDSILEKVKANVLKKPFTKAELENLVREGRGGKEPVAMQAELKAEYASFAAKMLQEEIENNQSHYEEQIRDIPNERKIRKIPAETEAWHSAVAARQNELQTAHAAANEKLKRTFDNKRHYMEGIFDFFYVGKRLEYPIMTYDNGQELVPAVFLGYLVDRRKKNPFAPSAIRLRFAIANSNKYLAMPASYGKDINEIKGASLKAHDFGIADTLERWEIAIRQSSVDRQTRFIITGNLLQAFSLFKGKLVSYTTLSGEVKKGILMPEYWAPDDKMDNRVVVPIERAINVIKSLSHNGQINASDGISFFRSGDGFKIFVPASKAKGGEVYLNPDLLNLVAKNNFEKVADRMVAYLPNDNLEAFVKILQSKFSTSVTLSANQFDTIKDSLQKKPVAQKPRPMPIYLDNNIRILELEAEALLLELELLNLKTNP